MKLHPQHRQAFAASLSPPSPHVMFVLTDVRRLQHPHAVLPRMCSLASRPDFFFGDDDGEGSQGSAMWMPMSLIIPAARDPYKVALRVLPILLLHGMWASMVVLARVSTRGRLNRAWNISPVLHTLLAGVLGLLLAFRTNQAWTRYWQAAQSWADVHRACHNLARLTSGFAGKDPLSYSTIMRHLIALPISLKQRARGGLPDPSEYYWPILAPGEADSVVRSPVPHLVLIASLSVLLQPLKAQDDGSGKDLALWGQCEGTLSDLQRAAAAIDLVARLPPPASYTTFTARFVLLWLGSLPLVLIDRFAPPVIPLVTFAVGWALYSTEELARLLDQPFGRLAVGDSGGVGRASGEEAVKRRWLQRWRGRASVPEAVPVEAYCERIVSELQQQVAITRTLQRRIDGGRWAVTRADVEARPFGAGRDVDQAPATAEVDATASTEDELGDGAPE